MHPAERYVGMAFDADTFDCADLVALVQREMFGRNVRLPNGRHRGARGQTQIAPHAQAQAERTDTPKDGDLVLMLDDTLRFPGHVGVWFHIAHEDYVLHAHARAGMAVLHRARDLAGFGAPIEGVYTWR